jgi:hypothetical protein
MGWFVKTATEKNLGGRLEKGLASGGGQAKR